MPQVSAKSRIRPPALQRGATIGIVAPASNVKRELLESGCERFRQLGYNPIHLDSIFEQDLYFAGSVERRARELEDMFVRDDVQAIVSARGGYGSNHLLEALDIKKIAAHPKIFAGYSDLTTLLTYISDAAGFVTFHAPMVTKDFVNPDGVDLASWDAAVNGQSEWSIGTDQASGVKALVEGAGVGTLYGGCLSLLAASLGTPYEIQTAGAILFIEDVATKPFQVDRMLMQLKLAGKLEDVRGLIFGEMVDCLQHKDQTYTLEEVILRIVGSLEIPIAYGLRSGHVSRQNVTLPIGVQAVLEVKGGKVSLKIVEAATAAR
jgi:muramoyltetrapeptide carboxypeptidase